MYLIQIKNKLNLKFCLSNKYSVLFQSQFEVSNDLCYYAINSGHGGVLRNL